ncbi:hypothetical protein NM688_g3634 [Phlebia brevispora]|uniref:Uncharacterized protein n=1 Tax=Phlebia brevispora TaxID=194682 RepID=A0ACC1T5F5_9APHY|nr:hypothetical protein NM688_g3634 [Phlebia brevispora]
MSGLSVPLPNGDDFWLIMSIPDGEATGLLVLVITSSVSALAVILLLSAIAISAWNTRKSTETNLFVRSHAAGYLISLFLCDLCQAIGSIMNARWYLDKAVRFEPFCIAQGVLKQIADVGISTWVTVIACHTFWVLFLRWPLRRPIMIAAMVFCWSFIGTLVITGPSALNPAVNGPFFAISGYWCWISPEYPVARITLDYMFMFIAGFSSSILYILVFLRLRGNILLEGRRVRFRAHHRSDVNTGLSADNHTIKVAKLMLLYPVRPPSLMPDAVANVEQLAFIAIVVPIAVCRFAEWSGHTVSFTATVFSDSVYLLSGLVNVLLFVFTRRVLPRHSIITKRFRKEPRQAQITGSIESIVSELPEESYLAEKMNEDPEDDKVFMRVDSPDENGDVLIPVHLVPTLSPTMHSPRRVSSPPVYSPSADHQPEYAAFPGSAAALMAYPQSPLPR